MLGGFRKKSPKQVPKSERRPERAGASGAPAKRVSASVTDDASSRVAARDTKEVRPVHTTHHSDLAWSLIVRPHISEKSTMLGEGKYILKVSRGANKGDLKRAVGDRYGVEVTDVKILNMPSKKRRRGGTIGIKPGFKKAVITLAKGQLIDEF